jgi:glutamate dehydrogenase
MKTAADKQKHNTIEKIGEMLRAQLPNHLSDPATRFTHRYYAGVAADDLANLAREDLYGAVLNHWQLASQRTPGKPLIRIYNPVHEQYGWQSPHTVIEIVCDDMPFLVDSVKMLLLRHALTVHLIIHPVMHIRRDHTGQLLDSLNAVAQGTDIIDEALLHFEVDQQTNSPLLTVLHKELETVLEEVRAVVEDWPLMQAKVGEIIAEFLANAPPIPADSVAECLDFLHWIEHHHFTFIGFRAYELGTQTGQDILRLIPGSGLGIFRDSIPSQVSHIQEHLQDLAKAPTLLILTKSTMRSTIHRPAHLDYIGIKRFDEAGKVIGEWRFHGLYTSLVYDTLPSEIPILRLIVTKVIQRAALSPRGHAGKAMRHILDTLPRDEMFQATEDELFELALGILQLQDHTRLKVFVRRDAYERFVSVLVFTPRDRYTTELRLRMQDVLLEVFEGQNPEFDVSFSEAVLARVHFIIQTPPGTRVTYDIKDIEAHLLEAMQSWTDKLNIELYGHYGEAQGNQLVQRYERAFPAAYRDDYSARTTVQDIQRLESLRDNTWLAMHLFHPPEATTKLLRFKVFGRYRPMALSDVLPILENMGMRVLAARPYIIEPRGDVSFWILTFDMTTAHDMQGEVLEIHDIFQETFAKVCQGEIENDGFNRLGLVAGLHWREVIVLRAICKYLLQTRILYSQIYMQRSLADNPAIARRLVELFNTRFDSRLSSRETQVKQLEEEIEAAIDNVASLDEDRILRHYLAVIHAMLRTNYYQPGDAQPSKNYLSFKLNPALLLKLPLPHPKFEIFVYSPRMEGIHLRGGLVARGGLRWSDRREDFRTEVLGLMKAQIVKNALIVPVGAKGGFVTKQLPTSGDRNEIQQEVIQCYQTFIRGLLDVTDNLVDGTVQPPPFVVRYDDDDPYLVVAADKGTASFSDIANEVAASYNFWLRDAFASGGTYGYDHKKMGITARGAWESVKRHFRELGMDTQQSEFSAVGIGDMSGDVFGNGMLQSSHIRLIAAFNHLHIFIDPNPDPASAYEERKRLFHLPRSSWADYDVQCLSPGGGVYPRTAKSIALSDEARQALGIEANKLTPNALIQAILQAPVDLLWNGGIGTYVKASTETHLDVGDRTNDNVRIDASELRCRVIGEGGNLGLTQRARIEFSRQGGLVYTDAIDNSGGVDCSDHEVNIKILLNRIVTNGDMTLKQRNQLLAEMTDAVAELVLQNNYLQTQEVSTAAIQAGHLFSDHVQLISLLEKEGRLIRRLEALPNDKELTERANANTGLTRPEIAVLLAYSKLRLYEELLDSDIFEDAYLSRAIQDYFPETLRHRFALQLNEHSLQREITATFITNKLINRMGATYCVRMQEEMGSNSADIVRAYMAGQEIFQVQSLWNSIEALDNQTAAQIQIEMIGELRRLMDRSTRWMLRNRRQPLDVTATIEQFADQVPIISQRLGELLHGEERGLLKTRTNNLTRLNAPTTLAQRIAGLDWLFSALDITEVANHTEEDIIQVAQTYFELGVALDFYWLNNQIRQLPRLNHWHRNIRSLLRDDLNNEQRSLTAHLMQLTPETQTTRTRVAEWLEGNQHQLTRYQNIIIELKTAKKIDIAMLSVAVRELRQLSRYAIE